MPIRKFKVEIQKLKAKSRKQKAESRKFKSEVKISKLHANLALSFQLSAFTLTRVF